ncbi:glycosyltransferase [Corynebacterium halotolerans]|uniref:glycosyltransferase n=1 Tax=Corynebacterium halotolerans TaxID=225326 RepID=UPI003CF2CB87
MSSFSPEADFQPLTMRDWLVELTASQPDLLFVESAWRGHRNSWWNEVQRCGPELLGILEWCNSRNIPTVFWNKEDPVHFSTFLNTAQLFDVIFTTDVDCVPRYKASLNHDRVYFLPFAAQPKFHNPIEEFNRLEGCSFAGAYYKKYGARNRDFAELSTALKETGRLDIYDRNYGSELEEQQFPSELQNLIVGGLSPEDISVAYKGYTYSLNLNSVKESQSMFARRVFELLASNTGVVSNYARGLKILFGDLTFTTDSPEHLRTRMAWVMSQPNGSERLRSMGLRKVLAEHTYAKRLEEIATRAGVDLSPRSAGHVLLVSYVSCQQKAMKLARLMKAQSHQAWELWFVGTHLDYDGFIDPRIHVVESGAQLSSIEVAGFRFLGYLDEQDWYGEEYLTDLLRVFEWADVDAVGHSERYVSNGQQVERVGHKTAWTHQSDMCLTRSLVKLRENDALEVETLGPERLVSGVATSTLEYCEGGAELSLDQLAPVTNLHLCEGMSLSELQDYGSNLDPNAELEASGIGGELHPSDLFEGLGSVRGLKIEEQEGKINVTSFLENGQHQYSYSQVPIDPVMLPDVNGGEVYFEATPGLNVMLAFIYYSAEGERLGHTMISHSRNTSVSWPEETAKVKVGIRALGAGSCTISSYSRAPRKSALHPPVSQSKTLIVTNRYPSYESLYQNGFVASRAETYADKEAAPEIFCVDLSKNSVGYREFNGIEVMTGTAEHLKLIVEDGHYSRILVHFLSRHIWEALSASEFRKGVTVWIHGFEAQPWWRRKSLYTDPKMLEEAKRQTEIRMDFWRDVFCNSSENWHFVFVSSYLAQQVFEDVGVTLDRSQYSIIPNVIDDSLFTYEKKGEDQRFKVLSIRPYASPIYANDLAVQAVLLLKELSPNFEQFEFAFYGDGLLFDEILKPLQGLENVKVIRGFLTRKEISEVHKDYGVFLVPSRMDTQGVSRGEAMASGLVPVTSSVAAIPEFVDEKSGVLTEAEDITGLASALQWIADDPQVFSRLSEGAALRVREQLSFSETVGKEMDLIGLRHRAPQNNA